MAKKPVTKMTDEEKARRAENRLRFAEVLAKGLMRDGASPEEAYRRVGLPVPDQPSS